MSVKKMAEVWELDLPRAQKFVLLAFADFADDEGRCYPSVRRIAWKTGYDERHIKRIVDDLRKSGLLEIMRAARPTFPAIYRVMPVHGKPLIPLEMSGGDILSLPWFEDGGAPMPDDDSTGKAGTARGVNSSPLAVSGGGHDDTPEVSEGHPGGGEMSSVGVTKSTGGGDTHVTPGVTPMSPKPSLNHQEPKRERTLPLDFALTLDQERFARSKGIVDPAAELEAFRAHYASTGETRADWDAAWQSWCIKAKKFGATPASTSTPKTDAERARMQAADKAAEDLRSARIEQRRYKLAAQGDCETDADFVARIYREAGEAMVNENVPGRVAK